MAELTIANWNYRVSSSSNCLKRMLQMTSFGDRFTVMKETRKSYDPDGRLLNDYFRGLLS